MPKTLETDEYLNTLKELITSSNDVSLRITGNSMAPFLIHQRDCVYIRRPERPLKRGDIILYQRDDGHYVVHRIIRAGETFTLCGDNQTEPEPGIRRDQIIGLVYAVKRKDVLLKPGDSVWDFFAGPWITLRPLRPLIIKMYKR